MKILAFDQVCVDGKGSLSLSIYLSNLPTKGNLMRKRSIHLKLKMVALVITIFFYVYSVFFYNFLRGKKVQEQLLQIS